MKYFYFLLLTICFSHSYGQNIVKIINITPGDNSISSTLPFDRPIILKWTAKEPIIIKYAGLELIKKGQVSEYYKEFAQTNSFFLLQNTDFGNSKVKISDRALITNFAINNDGKYELNIMLPPLEPNKFYDIKLLRRPLDMEANLYLDLFSSNSDTILFKKKLLNINQVKHPFEHIYIDGTRKGQLTLTELHEFYEVFLKKLYIELGNDGTDKEKIASTTAKIKAVIANDSPPNAIIQAKYYLKIFEAIQTKDSVKLKAAIHNLSTLQYGYVHTIFDDQHIGDMDVAALISYYSRNLKLQQLLTSLIEISETHKQEISNQIIALIIASELPKADDMFIFGQTLSSTTAVLDFDTRTGYTITPDFGFVYYGFQPAFNTMTPYVGFQLEFRYFDKNIPFNLIHPKTIWHYLSFTTGVTLTSLKKDGKRDDFFSGKSLLLGFGLRLSSATRITFGGILFNKENVNPLLNKKQMTITPFAGISIDLKLKSILSDFYGLIPTKKP